MTFADRAIRTAAAIASVILLVTAAFQAYWAMGGSFGLSGAYGGTRDELPVSLRVSSAVACVVLVAGTLAVTARGGWWRAPVRPSVQRRSSWAIALVMAASAFVNATSESNWERYQNAPAAAVAVLCCAVVALKRGSAAASLTHAAGRRA